MALSYLSVGLLALSSNAFLIPGDVNDLSAATSLKHPIVSQGNEQSISLDCPSCPYALVDERGVIQKWTDDVDSELEMTISTDGRNLQLNGVSFYPVQAPGLPPTLSVSQHRNEVETSDHEDSQTSVRLSYSLEYDEKKANDGSSLLTVVMTVMGLENRLVRVDDVEVKAIKDASGSLILHSVSAIPVSPDSPDAKCGNLVCRAFSKIITGIRKAKASAKSAGHRMKCFCVKCFQRLRGHGGTSNPQADRLPNGTVRLPTHFRTRPGMIGKHQTHHIAHHHQGFLRRAAHVMWVTAKMAFVPVLIGIAFGMAASAVGMLVGQLVVLLWTRFRRDDRVRYEAVMSDEKDGLPAYEDILVASSMSTKEVEAKA